MNTGDGGPVSMETSGHPHDGTNGLLLEGSSVAVPSGAHAPTSALEAAVAAIPAAPSDASTAPAPTAQLPKDLNELRKQLVQKRTALLNEMLSVRDLELRELLFLEAGGNLVDFEEKTDRLDAMVKAHNEAFHLHPDGSPILEGENIATDAMVAPEGGKKMYTGKVVDSLSVTIPPRRKRKEPADVASIFASMCSPETKAREAAARAERETQIIQRVAELSDQGLWYADRLPKLPEPPRNKTHWDYLLEEMAWMSTDFKQECKWKVAAAKKQAKAIDKFWVVQKTKGEREAKLAEIALRKKASFITREVKKFWADIEKLVKYKHQTKVEVKKKAAMGKHLDFLVGQTERYTAMLAEDLPTPVTPSARGETPASNAVSGTAEEPDSDDDFELEEAEEVVDDEGDMSADEKLDHEEGDQENEAAVLAKQSDVPLEDLVPEGYGADGSGTGDAEMGNDEGEAEDEAEDEEGGEDEEGEGEDDGGLAALLTYGRDKSQSSDGMTNEQRMNAAAASAAAFQPKGFTLAEAEVKTPVPHLLRATLREYQHIGLDWLVSLYEKKLNGILADEMGLGKTIMTISLLAHLACEKEIWGPHLIVVPTSVMLNWEMEFKKFAPAFKIMTYYGSQKERKAKRVGWSKPNSFHVCITSYQLAVQDASSFKRKKWKYLILDEAHNIKNFKSQRWQTLLSFNSKRRLLLTGTPLQNDVMELWSLMHFLMPLIFQSHAEFKDWFSNPLTSMVEGAEAVNQELIARLHTVLRPFLLRRLKKDVATQLPGKFEHVLPCPLSRRQRVLYDEFMSRADTRATLSGGNFLSIMNVLMQLRKVCNHPDLFEERPTATPFDAHRLTLEVPLLAATACDTHPLSSLSKEYLDLRLTEDMTSYASRRISELRTPAKTIVEVGSTLDPPAPVDEELRAELDVYGTFTKHLEEVRQQKAEEQRQKAEFWARLNDTRCARTTACPSGLLAAVTLERATDVHKVARDRRRYGEVGPVLSALVKLPTQRAEEMAPVVQRYVSCIPPARASPAELVVAHEPPWRRTQREYEHDAVHAALGACDDVLYDAYKRTKVSFPDKRLLQFDCGKLQRLAVLLQELKAGGHRVLIFTQMTKMLNVLETFLNFHGHTYFRLDGSTGVERRQQLMERFNKDTRVFCFILSTRSGGIGVNLTGADTVVFYDSDWNPAMDAQAQDRCHRIGQTRDVHIYRLISEATVEENILKKALQKRHLDRLVITEGSFTTEYIQRVDMRDIFANQAGGDALADAVAAEDADARAHEDDGMSQKELEQALMAVEDVADVEAMRTLKSEIKHDAAEFSQEQPVQAQQAAEEEELQEWEEKLRPIDRYAMVFKEKVCPVVGDIVVREFNAEAWELEELKRLKEAEELRMDEEEDMIVYEGASDRKRKSR